MAGCHSYSCHADGYWGTLYHLKQGNDWSLWKTAAISILLFASGYFITFCGFSAAAANPASTETDMELFFTFCSPNVVVMTAGMFLLLQKVRVRNLTVIKLLANVTKYGFGIYIVHYFMVGPVFIFIRMFDLPIPLQVPLMTILIFLLSWGFTWGVYQLLGKKAKWVMG